MLERIKARFRDWRTRFVIGAVVFAYMLSAIFAFLLQPELAADHGNIWRNFYASWVQDVIFFTIVGVAVIAYTEPFRADSATFDERVQAFYGPRVLRALRDYAKIELTRFGGYAPRAERTIVIKTFDRQREAFKIEVHSKFWIKNIFEDVVYQDSPPLELRPDKFDDPPSPFGEVEWITVDGKEQLSDGPVPFDHDGGFARRVDITIPRGGEIEYEYRYWMWTKNGEKHRQRPQRVVECFDMMVRNATSNDTVKLEFESDDQPPIELQPGESHVFPAARDATPRSELFVFRISSTSCEPAGEGPISSKLNP